MDNAPLARVSKRSLLAESLTAWSSICSLANVLFDQISELLPSPPSSLPPTTFINTARLSFSDRVELRNAAILSPKTAR